MGHPEFFEPRFDLGSIRFSSGVASPLPGLAGCPRHFFSLLAACGGEEKGEKEFFGVTPKPGRDAPLPALSFFECLFQTFGMTHACTLAREVATFVSQVYSRRRNSKKILTASGSILFLLIEIF
jgi:hypothetical protein